MIIAKQLKNNEFFKYNDEAFKVLDNKRFVKCINVETNECTYIDCETEVELLKEKPTYCTCYVEYPNKSHICKNGNWKCVDKYKNIRQLETIQIKGLPYPKYVRKTMCEHI